MPAWKIYPRLSTQQPTLTTSRAALSSTTLTNTASTPTSRPKDKRSRSNSRLRQLLHRWHPNSNNNSSLHRYRDLPLVDISKSNRSTSPEAKSSILFLPWPTCLMLTPLRPRSRSGRCKVSKALATWSQAHRVASSAPSRREARVSSPRTRLSVSSTTARWSRVPTSNYRLDGSAQLTPSTSQAVVCSTSRDTLTLLLLLRWHSLAATRS